MGVYELAGYDDYEPGLGLRLRLPKIKVPKFVNTVVNAVKRPAANFVTNLVPGGGIIRSVLPGIAASRPKTAPKPAPSPAGSATVQAQRALSTATNRPATAGTRGAMERARATVMRARGRVPVTQKPLATVEPVAQVHAVLQREAEKVGRGVRTARTVAEKTRQLREGQRKFTATANRAARNARTLEERARKLAEAGIPGADTVARAAQQAATVAQDASFYADRAGAAVSAGVTAGMAAGATGSESAGLATAGLTGFVKENPVAAAAIGAGALVVLSRAFSGRR